MDKDILQIFYITYSREVYLYLFGLFRDRYLAEDITQEAFVKALLSLPNSNKNVRAWLYKVARNLYFDNVRRTERESLGKERRGISDGQFQGDVLTDLIEEEENRSLYEALAKLSRRKREILLLQYFSGLSQKEIGKVLEITAENVRVLAFRAKKEVREYLKEAGYEIQ